MINMDETIRQLRSNAEAMRAMVETISDEQAQWKPNLESWCMREVMEHVYNEERVDFRKHLKELLSVPPQAWGETAPGEYLEVERCRQSLDGFLHEREASIAWLESLGAADWDVEQTFEWGTLSSGDVLVSWVEHDFLHMRQMIELLYAWNEQQARPYSVQYAGGW